MDTKMNTLKMYRQGDVLLRSAERLPRGAKQQEDGVVARGEATGHAHRVTGDGAVFRDPDSQQLWVRVMSSATVVHEEHRPIVLPRGIYEVIGQREYTPEAVRRVVD
jgi:hypothetical protein